MSDLEELKALQKEARNLSEAVNARFVFMSHGHPGNMLAYRVADILDLICNLIDALEGKL